MLSIKLLLGISQGQMDSSSKRMYDIFGPKAKIWKDLGPLDPNWFESLTAERLAGHASDQDELCANQEALFKPSTENRGPCSQMCSTPKLFKHRPTSSLQTESFSAEPEMLPWTKTSPCVLRMETSQIVDLFEALHSPKSTDAEVHGSPGHSPTSFGKHISERFGATIGDISWTSSLNTPPPQRSTLILSRKEGSSTVTISEGTLMQVHKHCLSPSTAFANEILPESPENAALLALDAELNGSLQAPMVPRAIKDTDVHKGVENANADVCTKSISILRKVRNEKVNRRINIPSNENGCGAVTVSSTHSTVHNEVSSSELLSGNVGLSQWSPFNLSEISPHSRVTKGKPELGPKEAKHGNIKSPPVSDLEIETHKSPASVQDTVDNVSVNTLQRPQLPHTPQISHPTPLPNGFSPSACLLALKQAKQNAKRGSGQQPSESIICQEHPSTINQSSVHDSGFSSVAQTALCSSTNKLETTATHDEKKVVPDAICQSEKDYFPHMVSFKTALNKNINQSPVSFAKAKQFFNNIDDNENVKPPECDTSNHDIDLTVSQKAEVKELCALLEQQSASQFEFTPVENGVVGNVHGDSQNKQNPSLNFSETDFDMVMHPSEDKALFEESNTNITPRAFTVTNKMQNVLSKDELTSHEAGGSENKSMKKSPHVLKNILLAPENVPENNENSSGFQNTPEDINMISSDPDIAHFRKPLPSVIDYVKTHENIRKIETRRGIKRAHAICPSSAKSFKRVKLSDCKEEKNTSSLETSKMRENVIVNETLSSGFTTAGGKRVELSKGYFEKVKHLWKDFDDALKTEKEFCSIHLTGTATFGNTARSKASESEHDSENLHCKTKPLVHEHSTSTTAPAANITNGLWPECTRGFLSASGKVLGVSAEAFLKTEAEAIIDNISSGSEIREASEMPKVVMLAEGTEKHAESISKLQNHDPYCLNRSGFTTASGKRVIISEEALKGARKMLTDNMESKNELQNASLNKTIQYNDPRGNTTCKSSTTHLVSTGKQECKPLLQNPNCLGSGFTTASGKKVVVSNEALNSAKRMLTDEMESKTALQDVALSNSILVNELGSKKGNSINQSTSSSLNEYSGPEKTKGTDTLFDLKTPMAETPALRQETKHSPEAPAFNSSCEKNKTSGFTTASGKTITVSDEALNEAMNFLTEKVDQDNTPIQGTKKIKDGSSLPHGQSSTLIDDGPALNVPFVETNSSGFTTASGKKVTVSEEALHKAMNFLTENVDQDGDPNVHMKKKSSRLPLGQSISNFDKNNSARSGFTTVSGKKGNITEAQYKAMNFLAEENDQDNDANFQAIKTSKDSLTLPFRHLPTNFDNTQASDISCVKNNRSDFNLTGGKKLSASETINKAMKSKTENGSSLPFGNLDNMSSDISSAKIRSGFSTASGKTMTVSEEALNKAINFLVEKTEQGSDTKHLIAKLNPKEGNTFKSQTDFNITVNISNLSPHSKTDMMNVPSVSRNLPENVPLSEHDQSKSPDRSPHNSSMVNLDVPSLIDCTTTQQRFLAQEALDCTRALLEDEVRAAQSPTASLEHFPTPTAVGSHPRKRHLEDVSDLPGLGRTSSEDFDRAHDRQKEPVLNAMKSSLSGLYKDRRVFQYHAPLHPNVTKSNRFEKASVNAQKPSTVTSTPVKSEQDLKSPLFVPPFLNSRTKACKVNISTQKERGKSCTFVPPFKKIKTAGSPIKTQHKDGNLVKEASKTLKFTPPAKKNPANDNRNTFPDETTETSAQCEAISETKEAHMVHAHKEAAETEVIREPMKIVETRLQETLLNQECLDLAQDLQDMRIRKKSRQTIRPIPGSLFLTKSSQKRHSFRAVVSGQTPRTYSQKQLYTFGVDQPVCQITSETAEDFCFTLLKFYKQESFSEAGVVQVADGGWLVPRRDGTVGKEEFYRALCDTPGVDPRLLSQRWVSNHYRWVVWKLSSMERAFPAHMASVCLTPEQVLLQLKYRYDVEVDLSRRPCLRKIMERDDTSAKTMVLCVCGTVSSGQSHPQTAQDAKVKLEHSGAVVWLTDGWYEIKAQLDEPLTALLHRGTISEGVKLITHGAQLVGSQEACSPLDAPDNLLLKVFANSTRRVRWDTRLGFFRDPRPFMLPLSSVFSAGGVVCCLDMLVLRAYPIQWMERKPDGGVVFRSERAEEKEARRYNNHKQKTMEAVYAKIKEEFENEEKERKKCQGRTRTVRREDLCRCQDGEELFKAVGDEATDVEAYLTPTQLQSLSSYRRSLLDQRQARLQERLRRAVEAAEASEGSCPKRDLATVWRLCITDYQDQMSSTVYQLSIWNPSSDLQAVLKEGGRYEVSNLSVSEGKTQSGRATVQLNSTRKTHFKRLQASSDQLLTRFQPRASVSFAELQKTEFVAFCGEVDLTGCVLNITDVHGSTPVFYLVDESLNFVKVHSLVNFARCGWEGVLELRGLVCLSNLQVRRVCASPTPVLYLGDMSALSTYPRESHLRQALSQLQQAIQDQEDFFVRAEKRLFEIMSSDGLNFPAVNPTTPQSTKTGPGLRTSAAKRPTAVFTPTVRNLGNSTPLTKKDPRVLKRRRALDYLCQFPPPPPLSPLSSTASPCVKKTFLPPRRSLSDPFAAGQSFRSSRAPKMSGTSPEEEGWVHDDELALIDTQELRAVDTLLD